MKTFILRKEDLTREWHSIDAKGQVLGRLASQVAFKLMGKHKVTYTPHVDSGDFVLVTNSKQIEVTGKKFKQKKYYRHSGYPGNLKTWTFEEKIEQKPEDVIILAVKRMLPKNKLGDRMIKRLQVSVDTAIPKMAKNMKKMEL